MHITLLGIYVHQPSLSAAVTNDIDKAAAHVSIYLRNAFSHIVSVHRTLFLRTLLLDCMCLSSLNLTVMSTP